MTRRRLLSAVVLLAVSLATSACSEQSSLAVDNRSTRDVVIRVYFNDFDESFGFRAPAGALAWAWAPLEGRVAGPIAVYDTGCTLLWSATIPPAGGVLSLTAEGTTSLSEVGSDARQPTDALGYTEACATAGNPRRLPPPQRP